jgi:hypothetical protein
MAAREPRAKNLAELFDLAPRDWSDVCRTLETNLTQAPGTGGNIERNPRCAFGVAIHGYDVALEGRAARVTDDARLQRVVGVFAEGGWAPTVADGGFTHEYSAPSGGPPPWYVYEFTPDDADAVATEGPGGAVRWTF